MTPRELGELVLSKGFVVGEAAQRVTPDQVSATIEVYEREARPMGETELGMLNPRQRSERATRIHQGLRTIGAKISPTMEAEQARMWVEALMVSLSKWPAKVVLAAVTDCITEPLRFLNEVDAKLHELAAERNERARSALFHLRRLAAEIERSLNPPQPVIEDKREPMTEKDVDDANAIFQRLGIETRYRYVEGAEEPETYKVGAAVE